MEADLDGGAGFLRRWSEEAAASECTADVYCMGFTNYGYLLSAVASPKPRVYGVCLYTKQKTSECHTGVVVGCSRFVPRALWRSAAPVLQAY